MARRTSGFTLIEVTVVLALAATMLMGLLATLAVSRRARDQVSEDDLAREACRAKLEELVELGDLGFGGLLALDGTGFEIPETPGGSWRLVSSDPSLPPGRIRVLAGPAPARPDLLRVSVEARWRGADGNAHRCELSTLIADGRTQ